MIVQLLKKKVNQRYIAVRSDDWQFGQFVLRFQTSPSRQSKSRPQANNQFQSPVHTTATNQFGKLIIQHF